MDNTLTMFIQQELPRLCLDADTIEELLEVIRVEYQDYRQDLTFDYFLLIVLLVPNNVVELAYLNR